MYWSADNSFLKMLGYTTHVYDELSELFKSSPVETIILSPTNLLFGSEEYLHIVLTFAAAKKKIRTNNESLISNYIKRIINKYRLT